MVVWAWVWRLALGYIVGTALAVSLIGLPARLGLPPASSAVIVLLCMVVAGVFAHKATPRRGAATPPPKHGKW